MQIALVSFRALLGPVLAVLMLFAVLLAASCRREQPAAALPHLELIDQAERAWQRGDVDQARQLLRQLESSGHHHPRADVLFAELHLLNPQPATGQRGSSHDAIERRLQRALETSPTWPKPRLLLARTYQAQQRLESMTQAMQDIKELYDNHPAGPMGLATLALKRGDLATAQAEISEALARDPESSEALLLAEYLAAQNGDRQAQIGLLNRFLRNDPSNAAVHQQLGELYASEQRYYDAEHALATAYRLSPNPDLAKRLAHLRQQLTPPATAPVIPPDNWE